MSMRSYEMFPPAKRAALRAIDPHTPTGNLCHDLLAALEEAEADASDLRRILHRNGFAPCDAMACNCNGWHPLSTGPGFYARFLEIEGVVGEHSGKTLLQSVADLVAERDALKAKLAALVTACEMALDIDNMDIPVDAFHDKWRGAPGYGNGDGSLEILSKAIAAAKEPTP